MQDEACTLFEEIEWQGSQLEQVVTIVEQWLEGMVTETVIQEFDEKEALVKQQVEATRGKINAFEGALPISEWLETSHRWVLGACWTLTKFWGILGQIWPFWDFDSLSKMERDVKQR